MDEEAQPSRSAPGSPRRTTRDRPRRPHLLPSRGRLPGKIRSFADGIGDIHPAFGTVSDAETRNAEARRHDIRVSGDLMPGHIQLSLPQPPAGGLLHGSLLPPGTAIWLGL